MGADAGWNGLHRYACCSPDIARRFMMPACIATGGYRWPLYKLPADLVRDPMTGQVHGRKTAEGRIVPYYTRGGNRDRDKLAGDELVWLKSRWEAYVVTIQGSARLRLADTGQIYEIGFAGTNGYPYTSPGPANGGGRRYHRRPVEPSRPGGVFRQSSRDDGQISSARSAICFLHGTHRRTVRQPERSGDAAGNDRHRQGDRTTFIPVPCQLLSGHDTRYNRHSSRAISADFCSIRTRAARFAPAADAIFIWGSARRPRRWPDMNCNRANFIISL